MPLPISDDEYPDNDLGDELAPGESCPTCRQADNCGDCNHFGTPYYEPSPGDVLGPCGCVDYHLFDCDGSKAPTKADYLEMYGDLDVEDWPDSEGNY